jgi:mycofactocin precursor
MGGFADFIVQVNLPKFRNKPLFLSGIIVALVKGNVRSKSLRYQFLKEIAMETKCEVEVQANEACEEALVLNEIQVEELAIDGICGVY